MRSVGVKPIILSCLIVVVSLGWTLTHYPFSFIHLSPKTAQAQTMGIAPEQVADYLHQVLAGDRAAYTQHVVEHSQLKHSPSEHEPSEHEPSEHEPSEQGRLNPADITTPLNVTTTEDWERQDGIPVPTQLFRLSYDFAAENGKVSYSLVSPWAIDSGHQPRAPFETTAMDAVLEQDKPYRAYREFQGIRYFSAMYPDRAIANSCVTCHNHHPEHQKQYPDKVFELNDVMGGMLINIPLESFDD